MVRDVLVDEVGDLIADESVWAGKVTPNVLLEEPSHGCYIGRVFTSIQLSAIVGDYKHVAVCWAEGTNEIQTPLFGTD